MFTAEVSITFVETSIHRILLNRIIHLPMKTRTAASILLLAILSACDSSNLPDVSGTDGALRFDFSGAHSGTFQAQGDGTARTGDQWAGGYRSRAWITVTGVRALGGGLQDLFSFDFPEKAAPYTVKVDRSQCLPMAPCSGGLLVLGMGGDGQVPGDDFLFSTGEIRVTSISHGRVRGTFSGTAPADPGTGAVQLVQGSFDVPLVTGTD